MSSFNTENGAFSYTDAIITFSLLIITSTSETRVVTFDGTLCIFKESSVKINCGSILGIVFFYIDSISENVHTSSLDRPFEVTMSLENLSCYFNN